MKIRVSNYADFFLKKKTCFAIFHIIHRNIAMKQLNVMGVTRTDLFTTEQNEISQIAKALAHPARVAIIDHLLKSNACINGDLVSELGLAQATISQHLKELKNMGIIQGTIEGVSVSYCINPVRWAEVKGLFTRLFEQFKGDIPCC
ncbi:MAG: DNA-binding transcriptional ArsR family regulator [Salibacteraceae bacterium]